MSARGRMMKASLVYAEEFCFAVFPCHWIAQLGACSCGKAKCESPGKHPLTRNGFKDASKDAGQIRAWWERWPDANIGIATGATSCIVVLDVDPRHGGDQSLAALEAEHGKLPDTPLVLTGGGGSHIYFQMPAGVEIHNSAGGLGPGLDIRGEGGYVIAPPSRHISGVEYSWKEGHRIGEKPVAVLPSALIDRLQASGGRRQQEAHENGDDDAFSTGFDLLRALAGVSEGERNEQIFKAACSFRATNTAKKVALQACLDAAAKCTPPFSKDQARAIVNRVYRRYSSRQQSAKPEQPPNPNDGRPIIVVDEGQLRDKVKKALAALSAANDRKHPRLLRRGGVPVRLLKDDHLVHVEELDEAGFYAELSEAVNWYKHRNSNLVDADPCPGVVKAIRGRREFEFPILDAVHRAPFFTHDGQLVATPGYHPGARVYLDLEQELAERLCIDSLPGCPTADDVAWARNLLLNDLLCDFPFEDQSSKAHAVALTLLPFVRKMIDGPTPNHAVTAPARGEGTGKGLLVQAACAPALGEVATIPETNDNDELRKFLLAILMEGAPIALLDNRKHEINSGVLAAVLTARQWTDRILGKSKTARPKVLTTWAITGNAIRVSGEIGRRTIWIRLNSNLPEPWKRTGFKHELPNWALQHRAELIRACVILVHHWIGLGRPSGKRTLGSFEVWARVIGGILEASGIEGFLAERTETAGNNANEDDRRWTPFISRWWEKYGEKAGLPYELIDLATELIPETERSTERSRVTRLGNQLAKSVGQVFSVEILEDSYLKIVREKVDRQKGGPRDGYKLSRSPKTDIKVGGVGGTYRSDKRATDFQENSSANLGGGAPSTLNEVGGTETRESTEKSEPPPTPPTSTGDFQFERF
jgi:hypothetical protein